VIANEIGVEPIINCAGNVTVLGGNIVDEEVIEAMKEAAGSFFDMPTLHKKAGAFIARLLGVEDAYISGGAEAGLLLSLAACMTGGELEQMVKLPKTDGMKNEVIIQSLHRNQYDYPLQFTGAKIVEVGNSRKTVASDIENAISERTAACVYFVFDPMEGVLPLEEVARVCHARGVPVIADGAGELPPVENLTAFLKMGADIAVFSGGKDIGSTNDTGLVVGRRDIIQACRRLGPHSYIPYGKGTHVFIGRPMKTSKEDIFGFVTALKRYLKADQRARLEEWERKAAYLVSELQKFPEVVSVRKMYDSYDQPRPLCVPKVEFEFKKAEPHGSTAEWIMGELQRGQPSIVGYVLEGKFYLSPQCLKPGEVEIVAHTISEILLKMK